MSKEASICDQCGEYEHECLCAETTLSKMQSELARLRKIEAAAKNVICSIAPMYLDPTIDALRDALKGAKE